MSIFDKLNNLTQQLNNAADKITGSSNNQQPTVNNGIGGLGTIGINELGNLPASVNIKTDDRKLVTDMNKFSNIEDYKVYLRNWLNNTGLFTEIQSDMTVAQCGYEVCTINKNNAGIEVATPSFSVYGCLNYSDVDNVLNHLKIAPNKIDNTSAVIICYINYTDEEVNVARSLNVHLLGINEEIEINQAIDLGDKKLPYVTMGYNDFTRMLCKSLNEKYKGYTGNDISQALGGVSNNLNNSASNLMSRTEEAVKDLAAGIGLSKPVQNTQPTTVSLDKTDKDEALTIVKPTQTVDTKGVSLNKD